MNTVWEALNQCAEKKNLRMQKIEAKDIVFEEQVKLNCFYCGRYGSNWKCPPNIPQCDYAKIFHEFENLALVEGNFSFTSKTYADVRTDSSVFVHKAVLEMEGILREAGCCSCLSFIGGSCKLCKSGCGKERCNNPYQARIPLEATGVNVVKTAKNYGIDISFPVRNNLKRVGLILW